MKDSENKDEKTISKNGKKAISGGIEMQESFVHTRKKKRKTIEAKFLILFQKLISETRTYKI